MSEKINNLILEVSNTALKYWLRRNELKHSANDVDALVATIEKSIEGGKLSYEQLQEGVREIEEHGGKRVYLKQVSNRKVFKDYETFKSHLAELKIPLSKEIERIRKSTGGSKLDYAVWLEDEVRIRYSELHTHVKSSKRKREFKDQFETKFITFSLEPKTGFLKILLDPPGDEHNHLDERDRPTDSAYVQFYMNKAEEIFGPIEQFDLSKQTVKLLGKPSIYEVTAHSGWTEDNLRVVQRGRAEIRQSKHYKDADAVLPDLIRGSWLKAMSGDRLERDLYMPIYPTEGKIHVRAGCLRREVDYAISRIREL